MTLNSTNQVSAGTVIFEAGKADGCIYIVLKGKVVLSGNGAGIVMGAGTLLGLEQLLGRSCSYTCKAVEDASVYVVSADSEKALFALLAANKDYNGITVYNHARLISELSKHQGKLTECATSLYEDLKAFYDEFLSTAQRNGCKTEIMAHIAGIEPFAPEVAEHPDTQTLLEYSKIPYESFKNFYSFSSKLAVEEMKRMTVCEDLLLQACEETADYVEELYMILAGSEKSLFRSLMGLAIDLKKKGADASVIDDMITACREYTDLVKQLIGSQTLRTWRVDEDRLAEMFVAYMGGGDFRDENDVAGAAVEGALANMVNSLNNSFRQITDYAGYPKEKAEAFAELLKQFAELPDKASTDEAVRKLRKGLTEHYYAVYKLAALESFNQATVPKAVEMLLDLGFISEKLITPDELVQILSLKKTSVDSPCRVYSMSEWLRAIYNEEQEPSRNDLGQDYAEALREQRKSGAISEEEAHELLSDPVKKLEYEINNVMVHANRVVNGQLSIFVPFLYSEQLSGDIERGYMTSKRLNFAVEDLTAIDFSVFCREALFVDEEKGIEREYEMKNVYPNFVIYPITGENVVMWQEITGRKRDSEGRFFAPAFTFAGLNDMLTRAFGHFRWALCKTIQGVNWNNIQVRSLTAEYSDYIQFYKKNHDLSDEWKEKVKLQIQRGRNNLRQVFTLDYEAWIKAESTGSVRLNKVVREMLATYCPFAANIRENICRQPIFEAAFSRSNRERGKKVHELELRHKALEAKGIEVPEELVRTLEFYKSL
ncbi:MAG: cyclic nucleotide-binding domain-containing protein [Lachnospiraceae bacterium]|nr:cyclic nucleotide-binding domain-containing protein [Lachnospiraceae bacterium]